jgi:CheY-like chemotaxis protein
MANEEKDIAPDNSKKKEISEPPSSEKITNTEATHNILVVDDAKELRAIIVEFLLLKFNCKVYEAENGKEGMKIITESNVKMHLVLCDIMMPIMDGITFFKKIKSTALSHKIPVIFFTGKNDKETLTNCIKLGAADIILKPYDLEAVTKKLEKFIKLRT